MVKVVLIHPNIYEKNNSVLINSFLSDVVTVNYSESLTESDVLQSIGTNASNVTHLAFLYHFPGFSSLPFFTT